MASIKVFKPTHPVNLLNTPIAPKLYTLSYYEWLETQGRDFNINYVATSGGISTDFLLAAILKTEILFIKSFTVSGFPLVGEAGSVNLNFQLAKIDVGYMNLNPSIVETPHSITKTFNPPLKITGGEFVQLRCNNDYLCSAEVHGFIVNKSLLFF